MKLSAKAVEPGKHDHLVLGFDEAALVFTDPRMFGRIRFEVSRTGPPDWWRELPPEVLSRPTQVRLVGGLEGKLVMDPLT